MASFYVLGRKQEKSCRGPREGIVAEMGEDGDGNEQRTMIL